MAVPLLLIFANTALTAFGPSGAWVDALLFLGSPIVAVGLGLVLALYGVGGRMTRQEAIRVMEDGMKSAGIILLVTGAGGALGQVLRDSGTGDYVASLIARTPLPPVLLPFLVATFVRLVQGSGTVAMITSASITAPILATADVNPAIATQAAGASLSIASMTIRSLTPGATGPIRATDASPTAAAASLTREKSNHSFIAPV